MKSGDTAERIASLERRTRRLTIVIAVGSLLTIAVAASSWTQQPSIIRARALVIVDSMGRERIVMGGPIPEPAGARIAPSTGLAIRDTAGAERFGMGLFPDGRFVMGFDAPPGTGDDRNRERITIVADQRGGAHIRFLDRRTAVRGYLMLGDDNNVYLQLIGDSASKRFVRRIGVFGDTTASTAR